MTARIAAFAVLFMGIPTHAAGQPEVAHPASQMIKATTTEGKQIMDLKSVEERNARLCALLKRSTDLHYIGNGLLGEYAKIKTDQAGVKQFIQILPSLGVSRIVENFDKLEGTADVDNRATDLGKGRVEVVVNAHSSNGNAYELHMILVKTKAGYLIQDLTYLGNSGVQYAARDVQNDLYNEYQVNPKTPVTSYTHKLMADPKFINCH